jgi:CRP-like cAMP-binding protein
MGCSLSLSSRAECGLNDEMPSNPDLAQMLLRSKLLGEMDHAHRAALALRFEPRPFSTGQVLIAAGAAGGELLEVLAGTADVFVRDGDSRFRVAELTPGSLAGERSFFDPHTPRNADVIGSSEGIVAALPRNAYLALVADEHPAAAALERVVMNMVAARLNRTDARIGRLLEAHRTGGLLDALGRIFGRPTPTAGVKDG